MWSRAVSSEGEISFAMEIMQTASAAKLKESPNSPSELCLRGRFNVLGHVMRRSGSPHRLLYGDVGILSSNCPSILYICSLNCWDSSGINLDGRILAIRSLSPKLVVV